jgi:hypothetical protein
MTHESSAKRRLPNSIVTRVSTVVKVNERAELRLAPELTQTVKTLLAVRCKILDRQNDCSAYWFPAGEAEAGSAGAQPAEE